MNAPTSWIRNPAIRSPRPNAETPARARLQINKSIPETRTVSPIKFIKIGQVMSQVRLQPTSLWRDSFYDSRHGDGTDLTGKSEKQSRILHFTGNFYYAFIAAVFGTVGDETVFKNLVLVRRRVTERQEAVIVIDRYFDNHLFLAEPNRWGRISQVEIPGDFGSISGRLAIRKVTTVHANT